jgi:hypothetical protein
MDGIKLNKDITGIKYEVVQPVIKKLHNVFNYPFSMCILGQKRSGKSNFIQNLLINDDLYKNVFTDIFICSPAFEMFSHLISKPQRLFRTLNEQRLSDIIRTADSNKDDDEHTLLIMDDSMGQDILNNNLFLSLISTHRNKNLSVIMVFQNVIALPIRFRELTDIWVIFKLNKSEIKFVSPYIESTVLTGDVAKALLNNPLVYENKNDFITVDKRTNIILRNLADEVIIE